MTQYTDAENEAWARRNADALKARRKRENGWRTRQKALEYTGLVAGIAVVIGLIVGLLFAVGHGGFGPESVVDVTVTSVPERVLVGGGGQGDRRLIVGTDAGDFYVDDGPLLGVDNSFQLFSMLQKGHRYRLTVVGRRSSWLSMKPYITRVTPLEDSQ